MTDAFETPSGTADTTPPLAFRIRNAAAFQALSSRLLAEMGPEERASHEAAARAAAEADETTTYSTQLTHIVLHAYFNGPDKIDYWKNPSLDPNVVGETDVF